MRVLFVYPFPPAHTVVAARAFHHGIGYLSAVLRRDGHETALLTLTRFASGQVDRAIRRFAPDLVAISATSDQFPLGVQVAERAGRRHGLPVLIGGIHATMAPEQAIEVPGLLGICLGEGEGALLELVRAMDSGQEIWGIRDLWLRRGGEIVRNPPRPLDQDLDALPFPDREIFGYQSIVSTTGKASFSTGRGCPYTCRFCANNGLRRSFRGLGRFVRQRSPGNVIDEVLDVSARYRGVRQVAFEDETFTFDRSWTRDFCVEYARRVDRPFAVSTRYDHLDEEVIGWLRDAGCFQLRVGIESGNEALRTKVLGKKITNARIREVSRLIRDRGIELWTFNMVGLPGETEEDVRETIRMNREVRPSTPFVSVFRPYPGTDLERECRERGWLSRRSVKSYFQNVTVLDQPSISPRRVAYYHNIFPWEVMYPRLAFAARALSRVAIPGTKTASLYDVVFPVVFYGYKLRRFLTGR